MATRDPKAGVALALGIQDAFYEYDWGTEDIDDVYKDQTGYEGTAAAYRRLWNGLRVRVGVHYGTAQAIFDEVTRGYDYYGTVVNAASRIESVAHGGQVVVSEAVLNALAGADLDYTSVSLGVQQLRGLPAPLTLVQLSPERFQVWPVSSNPHLMGDCHFIDPGCSLESAERTSTQVTRRANRKKRLTVLDIVEHPNQEGDTCFDWTSQYCWTNGWNCLWRGHSVYRNRPLIPPQFSTKVGAKIVVEIDETTPRCVDP